MRDTVMGAPGRLLSATGSGVATGVAAAGDVLHDAFANGAVLVKVARKLLDPTAIKDDLEKGESAKMSHEEQWRYGASDEVNYKNGRLKANNPRVQSLINYALAKSPDSPLHQVDYDGYLRYNPGAGVLKHHLALREMFTLKGMDFQLKGQRPDVQAELDAAIEKKDAAVAKAKQSIEVANQSLESLENLKESADMRPGSAIAIRHASEAHATLFKQARLDKKAAEKAIEKVKEIEGDEVDILPSVLLRVLKEGSSALGNNKEAIAHLAAVAGQMDFDLAPGNHPRKDAREGMSDEHLSRPIHEAIRKASLDEKVKIGATMLLNREREKGLDKVTVGLWGGSVGGSAGIEYLVKKGTDPLKDFLFGVGFDVAKLSTGAKIAAGTLDAAEAIVPETYDAVLVKKLQDSIAGKEVQVTWGDVGEGLKAGLIAFVASLPSNIKAYFASGSPEADMLLSFIGNQFAVFGCGAIVPIELAKKENELNAATVASMKMGLQAPAAGDTEEEAKAYVQGLTYQAMKVTPETETAHKALALTALAGMVPWLTEVYLKAPKYVLDMMQRTIFNPIESTAMNCTLFLAKNLGGMDGFITTDDRKLEQLFGLVFDKNAAGEKITDADLKAIFEPNGEWLGRTGRRINTGLGGVGGAFVKAGSKLGINEPSLADKIDYSQAKASPDLPTGLV